jgi:HAMP domain-containing protein
MDLRLSFRWLIGIVGAAVLIGAALVLWRGLYRQQRATEREAQAVQDQTWQAQLHRYVDLLNQDDGRMTSVQQTARATRPERFTPEMSRFTWTSDDDPDLGYVPAGARPLPFPPTEIWCAVLAHQYTTDPELAVPDNRDVVVIARHQEGDRALWVGHRIASPADPSVAQHIVDEIGCPLTLEEVADRKP